MFYILQCWSEAFLVLVRVI